MQDQSEDMLSSVNQPVPRLDSGLSVPRIIGVGASAGGLEALEQLIGRLPDDLGAAVVIVQHLSPDYKSFMSELLLLKTSMKVLEARNGMQVVKNHIYLIPAKSYLTVHGGMLHLKDYPDQQGIHLPIDVFLESLAAEQGSQSVGVILSGTGADGTSGVEAVHRAGGIVIVQNEETAKFNGMPRSAIQTGVADYVTSPAKIADEIVMILKSPSPADTSEDQLRKILTVIRKQSGIDFSSYKQNGMMRRIERRMKIAGIPTLRLYLEYMMENTAEAVMLQKDFLIGVTHFFRDKEAFQALYEKVIPGIFETKLQNREKEIRIWIAGCSTGEEAYSIAMLFKQYIDEQKSDMQVRIFATDLDREAVDYAGVGVYPKHIEEHVPGQYLSKYFFSKEGGYQVSKDIRKMIVFAPHNIIKDPPFVNLDLISCRNMMIYFQPDMQKKILSLFHFALNTRGFLFLGPSESIGKLDNLFKAVNRKWNIFCHKELYQWSQSQLKEVVYQDPGQETASSHISRENIFVNRQQPAVKKPDDLHVQLVEELLPPCVILNEKNEVIHTIGDVNKYISMPKGRVSLNINKMIAASLSMPLGTGIYKARREKQKVTYIDIKIGEGHNGRSIKLTIQPLLAKREMRNLIAILFEETERAGDTSAGTHDMQGLNDGTDYRILDLERELQYTQDSLQATIEELETANEELQSTNEELIAANEEMQSSNEELQSVNEELITVNSEHQRKIQELIELNNDMDNFLLSTKIGTIFLDTDMCIRRFTPSATEVFHLMEVDIGRPIHHISHKLCYGSLIQDAAYVLATSDVVQKELQCSEGNWYSVRVLPYRTTDNLIRGVVVTVVKITELKLANKELQKLSYAIEQSPSMIMITDFRGKIEYVNPVFVRKTGYQAEEIRDRSLKDFLIETTSAPQVCSNIEKHIFTGDKWTGELKQRTRDGEWYWVTSSVLPIENEDGEIIHYLKVSEDITERKKTEELLRKSEMLSAVGELAAGIAHEIRNPLTALKGFVQLMKAQGGNETYISIMLSEFNRIEHIINELLLLSKPKMINFQPQNLLMILNDVLLLIDTQALLNKVTIHTELDAGHPYVHCVENQLKQVFINLFKNAIEAMPEGGNIYVSITRKDDGDICMSIRDEGCGIPADKLPRLGEPFFTTKEKGTGLGLMVSYNIIEGHNGVMRIQSEEHKGTTVTIELPAL
ncbi:chemotaxis protein CheB [Paenibacillus tarimensis]|uniref:chemotaxis protein CheB n=1 Tax=Paenibacillus tarimensis TaxID=416012 RepID=UPI001F303C5E|nr:chemotaxis protein CheB [Paenibacillus tarimensis]MCF2945040.1 PAS domain-containing protein [Paenibacillus tarimensis]